MNRYSLGRQELTEKIRRYWFLQKIRPNILATPLYALAFPFRRLIEHEGLKLNIDPASHLGRSLLLNGSYEPETFAIFRKNISAGDTILRKIANVSGSYEPLSSN